MCKLTKQDILALKQATAIIFQHREGKSYIRCVKKVTDPVYTGDQTLERRIECDAARGNPDYWTTSTLSEFTASCYEGYVQDQRLFQTVISLLRPDMELRLIWSQSNNNQYVNDAGLHADELYLQAIKPNGDALTFLVSYSVCKDNSARMIKS